MRIHCTGVPLKTLGAMFVCALAGLATLGAYALNVWAAPTLPLVIGFVAIFLPVVVVTFALEPETRRAPWSLAAATVALATCMGLMFPTMWYSPKVRALAATKLADRSALLLALDDGSEVVRLRACEAMSRSDIGTVALAGLLAERPSLATACLTSPNIDNRQALDRHVWSSWMDELTHGSSATCDLAEAVDRLDIDAQDRGLAYLECAVSAESSAARECCVSHLGKAVKLAEWTRARRAELDQRRLTNRLLLVAFQESETMKSVPQAISSLGIHDDAMRFTTLDNACQGMIRGDAAESSLSAITWVLSSFESCLREEERSVPLNPVFACRVITATELRDLDSQLCAANQQSRQQKLQEMAEEANRPSQDFGELVGQISAGASMREKNVNFEGYVDAASTNGGVGLNAFNQADLLKIGAQIQAQADGAPNPKNLKRDVSSGNDRLNELRTNPNTKAIFDAKSPQEMEKIRGEFEAREAKAGKDAKKK